MKHNRIITLAAIGSLFYWVPSVTPMAPFMPKTAAYACVSRDDLTFDTAFAGPCLPIATSTASSPWPAIGIFASVVSVMANAVIVWHSECRELTSREAMTAMALPGIGIAINQSNAPNTGCGVKK